MDLSYSVEKGRQLGYQWIINFFAGTIKGATSSFTWMGNSTSMSWLDVVNHVDLNYNKPHDFGFFLGNGKEEVKVLDNILIPYLKCYEISNFGSQISISSKLAQNVYLVDRNRMLNYRMMKQSMIGDSISQDPRASTTLASNTFYSITTNQLRKRQDIGTCTNERFSDCSLSVIKAKMIELLNCIPPWLAMGEDDLNDPTTCKAPIVINDEKKYKSTVKFLELLAFEMKFRSDVRIETDGCMQSCTQLTYEVKNVGTERSDFDDNWINLKFEQIVRFNWQSSKYIS